MITKTDLVALQLEVAAGNVLSLQQEDFPGSVTNGVMTGWGWLKTELIREAGAGHFTLHDMRRTCRTLMSRLGVVESVAELAIGHVKEALVATYDFNTQWNARCDAFDRVSGHIGGLISE